MNAQAFRKTASEKKPSLNELGRIAELTFVCRIHIPKTGRRIKGTAYKRDRGRIVLETRLRTSV